VWRAVSVNWRTRECQDARVLHGAGDGGRDLLPFRMARHHLRPRPGRYIAEIRATDDNHNRAKTKLRFEIRWSRPPVHIVC
jgi:hypothetical protein